MTYLAIRLALRDWKKIILIALLLSFTGSMPIYYNTIMHEMQLNAPNNISIEEGDSEKYNDMETPPSRAQIIVSAMSFLIVLASAMFQLNMLIIEMISKKKEYNALRVIGVSEKQLELFPFMYSILIGVLASIIIAVFWIFVFPLLKSSVHSVNLGLILLIIIFYFTMSTIIGVKARVLSEYMSKTTYPFKQANYELPIK